MAGCLHAVLAHCVLYHTCSCGCVRARFCTCTLGQTMWRYDLLHPLHPVAAISPHEHSPTDTLLLSCSCVCTRIIMCCMVVPQSRASRRKFAISSHQHQHRGASASDRAHRHRHLCADTHAHASTHTQNHIRVPRRGRRLGGGGCRRSMKTPHGYVMCAHGATDERIIHSYIKFPNGIHVYTVVIKSFASVNV